MSEKRGEQLDDRKVLAKLDTALDRGIADADAGRVMEIKDAFRLLRVAMSLPSRP